MSGAAYVERARDMARYLEDMEYRNSGDRNIARQNAARRHGIGANVLKSLRYYPPKQIAVDLFHKLCLAVEDAARHQILKLEHDIEEARASLESIDDGAVRSAVAALETAQTFLNDVGRGGGRP